MSRQICDPILKELEGPTKDGSAYWRRFCKVDIITSYHYIIVGDTYKRHTMPHEYHNIIHKSNIRLRMNTNRNSTTYTLLAQAADPEPIP